MQFERVLRSVFGEPWAILPSKLAVIADLVRFRAAGGHLTAAEIQDRIGAAVQQRPTAMRGGAVAVLPLHGVIHQRMNLMSEMSGGTSTEMFAQSFRAAMADDAIRAIVIDVDSPGGGVYGVDELAAEILRARGSKRVVAVANSLAASAAYYIASAAEEVVVTPSGEVGSIGVFTAHQDLSKAAEAEGVKTTLIAAGKYKVEGNPFEPLSDEARAELQSRVDAYYGLFVAAVARGRNVTAAQVRGGFGEGRVVGAREAVRLGMADRVGTLDETIGRLLGARPAAGAGVRGLSSFEIHTEDDPEPVEDAVPLVALSAEANDALYARERLRLLGA